MSEVKTYEQFLKAKVVIAEDYGFEVPYESLHEKLFPHQKDIVHFCLRGGRRAIFASFGLGKTFMQLEIARQCILKENKPFLIVCPLGVAGEFKRDNKKLGTGLAIDYITDTDDFENANVQIYLTNYERIRKGDIDASLFCGVSFDEASILRNLQTETTNYVLQHFKKVPYRFVATATPTPNDYIEILNYADYLGVISRGHALTRFFQRDSTKAGHLTLYPNKKKEFWQWVSTWAAFINTPADYGYDSTGYDLPELNIIEHCITYEDERQAFNKYGEAILFKDISKSLLDVSREKKDSLKNRCAYLLEIISEYLNLNETCNDGLQRILSDESRVSSSKIKGILSSEQGQNRQGSESQLLQRVGKKERSEEINSGTESGEKCEAQGEVRTGCATPGISQKENEGLDCQKSREETEFQIEGEIQHEPGGLSNDLGNARWRMRNLRDDRPNRERAKEILCRSLSYNWTGEGDSLSSLQFWIGALQRQYSHYVQSNRVPKQLVIFCDRNEEQELLTSSLREVGFTVTSITGNQSIIVKEQLLEEWLSCQTTVLISKKTILGSGVNLQQASDILFVGIDYKFNDWIQSIHRCYRFGQTKPVTVHVIYTENEYEVMKVLKEKWAKHLELNRQMIDLVRTYGLNSQIIKAQMERQLFKGGKKLVYDNVTLYNNDTVIVHSDKKEMPDNSVDMILTSIPFGDHYEYSDNYNDFGHNHGNDNFFKQMDYLTPHLLRVLKPGRIAAIHVKDRIRYSYQNGTSFTTIADFSGQTVAHFTKEHVKKDIDHIETLLKQKEVLNPSFVADFEKRLNVLQEDYKNRFYLLGKITVTTDVVAENNQTYRLGWTEQCKDATKMGVGLPEYVLLFRKAPTHSDNAYADEPVKKEKSDYTKALWQLDAHAYHRSSGNRFLTSDELKGMDVGRICKLWKQYNEKEIYDFLEHLRICEELDEQEKLSSTFMTLPVHSNNDMVWTDVNRMNTLNAKQVSSKKEKHICPLQFDIIERLINRFSMPGEIIDDPFGGLFSTPYKALELGRKAMSVELNSEYFNDGLFYIKALMHKLSVPTLFDTLKDAV